MDIRKIMVVGAGQMGGGIAQVEAQAVLKRLKPSVFHEDAFDCQLIIEAATEKMEIKGKIFSDLDKIAPAGAILAIRNFS